jgi:hypothetical protein
MLTYLISGPIKSRAVNGDWHEVIDAINKELKNRSPNNQLIVSTYPNEIDEITNIKIVVNEDPGYDRNFYHIKNGTKLPRNTMRMLTTTLSGIKLANSDWCLRSRIELLPKINNVEKHIDRIEELIRDLDKIKIGGAVFLSSNFNSSITSRKGSIVAFSDIFAIMRTQDIRAVWAAAESIYLDILRSGICPKRPLTNEQIIGQGYMRVFYNLYYKKFNSRYFFRKDLFMKELEVIEEKLILIKGNSLFIEKSKVSSGPEIIPRNMNYKSFLLIKFQIWRIINYLVSSNIAFTKFSVLLIKLRNLLFPSF